MPTWSVVTGPAEEPVTVAEAQAHSYITTTNESALITRMLASARMEFEELTNVACVAQTIDESFTKWPTARSLALSCWPLVSVASITYTNEANTPLTLSTDDYVVDAVSQPGRIYLAAGKEWPTIALRPGPSITVRYVAGWANALAVPAEIKSLILLAFGDLYENRERTVLQPGVTMTMLPHVRQRVLSWRRQAV